MRISYNAPVILTFSLTCAAVLLYASVFGFEVVLWAFSVPGNTEPFRFFGLGSLRLVTHVIGHLGWTHLLANLTFVLLIGPILEEKYGSVALLVMMILTAVATGTLNVLLFPTGLLGASGIVFMFILLISFTNIRDGEIPLTFLLVVLLFLVKETMSVLEKNSISEFAHIIGGLCGAVFGFVQRRGPSGGETPGRDPVSGIP